MMTIKSLESQLIPLDASFLTAPPQYRSSVIYPIMLTMIMLLVRPRL
jgi:hypothetical protein